MYIKFIMICDISTNVKYDVTICLVNKKKIYTLTLEWRHNCRTASLYAYLYFLITVSVRKTSRSCFNFEGRGNNSKISKPDRGKCGNQSFKERKLFQRNKN